MKKIDPEGLLCALILAPRSLPRNRYFSLYEDTVLRRVRRRAGRVRGIIRQLSGTGKERPEITGEQVLEDGRLVIRYRIGRLSMQRTAALSELEAATLRYALHRAGVGSLRDEDKAFVERALRKLGLGLELGQTG